MEKELLCKSTLPETFPQTEGLQLPGRIISENRVYLALVL